MDILGLIALAKSSKGSGNTSLFRFKGAVSTVNQLPIVGQNYDVYHVNENGYEYVWIDTYWEPLGNIVDMSAYRTAAVQDTIDIGKQNKITASGLLKGDGQGGVSAAAAGTDYVTPSDYAPNSKTAAMTQPVGRDASGKLWTEPGGGNVTTVALNISDAYNPTTAYAVGDFCIKDNVLYKCSTAIASGGEEWNAAHWTQTTIADELRGGGTSIDLGITGASVGGFAKVKAVDANGKPTEWAAQTLATWQGGNY